MENILKLFLKVGLFSLIAFTFQSCKTAEQIKREKLVDTMAFQIKETQTLNAGRTVKMQQIEDLLTKLQGRLEQSVYSQKQAQEIEIRKIESDVAVLKENFATMQNQMDKISRDLTEQKQYINKVLKLLKTATAPPLTPYNKAMSSYRKKQYTKAKPLLLKLLNNKKIKGNKRARVYHNLGMVSFIKKDYQKALVYFSKLYTNYPKASYNSNGLLYLGKSFQKLKQIEQARQTFKELIEKYPKSSSAKNAKKILKKL